MPIGDISNAEAGSSVRAKLNLALDYVDERQAIKVYRALITQLNQDPPVATVLENTFGSTLTWSYSQVGIYTVGFTNAFTANKTFILFNFATSGDDGSHARVRRMSANEVQVETTDGTFALTDSIIVGQCSIEIIVYP